jgi:hypothetical protein
MNVGLLSVTASVYQMMRGAEMLFAALFAVLFLKRHLNKYHYMGITCCVVSAGQGMERRCSARWIHGSSLGRWSRELRVCCVWMLLESVTVHHRLGARLFKDVVIAGCLLQNSH